MQANWIFVRPDAPGGDIYVRDSADGGVTFTMSFTVHCAGDPERQLGTAHWLCDLLNRSEEQRARAEGEIARLRGVVRQYEEAAPELLLTGEFARSVVHVLWNDRALCEDDRLRGAPTDWPAGQSWISLETFKEAASAVDIRTIARCEVCWTRAQLR